MLLVLFVGVWCIASYFLTPHMDEPDGSARVTGSCGDTMEIGLKIENNIVVNTHSWTDGCAISKLCVEAAVRLAQGHDIEGLKKINMISIIDELGSLPDTHLHCAQLAEITLQRALSNSNRRNPGKA